MKVISNSDLSATTIGIAPQDIDSYIRKQSGVIQPLPIGTNIEDLYKSVISN